MASHKIIWCTIILAVSFTDALPRRDSSASFEEERTPEDSPGYRFGEEYFTPEATQTAAKRQNKPDGCEKVVRDSMVCMVCSDPNTHAKYEQCSYVPYQSDKSFSYAGSDTKKPSERSESQLTKANSNARKESIEEASGESEEAETSSPYSGYYSSSQSKESEEDSDGPSSNSPSRSYDDASGEYVSESERLVEKADKSKCKEEKRDNGMTCKVCADPDTGGNFEKCDYAYQPNDKAYKFSRSSRFGNPREEKSKGKAPKKAIRRVDGNKEDDEDKNPGESNVTERKINDKCREVKKNSMTCTVCTDPKTGRNSEQCSYSYDPADKLFTYSQSRSFGSKDPKLSGKAKESKE